MKKYKEDFLKNLIKHNILGLKSLYTKILVERHFRQITMDFASACNAKCPFCPRQYQGHPFHNNDIMSEEVFETIFKQLKKLPKVRTLSLYAYGEPLLNKNAGKFIQKLRTLKGRTLILSTNTTNMDKFTDDLMLLDTIQFSIDGWDKESYENTRVNLKFEETIEKLKNFDAVVKERRAQGLPTPSRQIHCLYTKKTDLDAFVKCWSPYVDVIRFTHLGYVPSPDMKFANQEIIDSSFEYKKLKDVRERCSYIMKGLTLNAAGKVTLCCDDFDQKMELGDYRNLKKAFNNKISKQIAKGMIFNEPNYCDRCVIEWEKPTEQIEEYQPNIQRLKQYENENLKVRI